MIRASISNSIPGTSDVFRRNLKLIMSSLTSDTIAPLASMFSSWKITRLYVVGWYLVNTRRGHGIEDFPL